LQTLAKALPLTQMLIAARAVMIDGATLIDIAMPLTILLAMTAAFLSLSSVMFKWRFT
jgi:ABC-type multidrug transport system permease subunit